MSEYQLTREIIALSFAQTWTEAKLEWEIAEVYRAGQPDACLCGHFPIIEVCVLVNKATRHEAKVGNCCAKKFLGLRPDDILRALERVKRNPKKSLNAEAIAYAFKMGWITEWERRFYFDIEGMRGLSDGQISKRTEINKYLSKKMRAHEYASGRRGCGKVRARGAR